MQNTETKVLAGSLDFDNDPRFVKTGDYLDIRNFRGSRSDTGNDGTLENVKSLLEVTDLKDASGATITLPDGVNKCIGTYTSDSTKRSFIWVWNSEGVHTIWEYGFQSNELTLLVKDLDWSSSTWADATSYSVGDVVNIGGSQNYLCEYAHTSSSTLPNNSPSVNGYYWKEINSYLNFDEFNLIYGVVELTRDGDTLLIWTDGENEVKYINADRLVRTTGDVYPTPYEEEYFDLIPTTPQLGIPIYDTTASSTIETLSSSGNTDESNLITGRYFQFRYQWEYADGMRSLWSPISKVAVGMPSFYNETGANDILKLRIPNRSNGGNNSYCKKIYIAVREVFSGNSGDFYVCKEIDATDTTQSSDDNVSSLNILSGYGVTSGADQFPNYYEYDFYGTEPLHPIDLTESNELYSWLPKKVRSLCLVGDNRLFVGNTTEGNDITDLDVSSVDYSSLFKVKQSGLTNGELVYTPQRTIKRGSNQKYGVIYSDSKGRVSSVTQFSSTDIPWYASEMASSKSGAYCQVSVDFDITPPEWAEYYQIVTSKNRSYDTNGDSNGKFIQLQIFNPVVETTNYGGGGIKKATITADLTYIKHFNESYGSSNIAVKYDFIEGDRIRLMWSQDGTHVTPNTGSYIGAPSTMYDAFVQSYDPNTNVIVFDFTQAALDSVTVGSGDWVEIYTPNKNLITSTEENLLWYEFGEAYKITRDSGGNKAHAAITDRDLIGTNVDQITGSTDATVCLSGGDSWLYTRRLIRKIKIDTDDFGTDIYDNQYISIEPSHDIYKGQIIWVDFVDNAEYTFNDVWVSGLDLAVNFPLAAYTAGVYSKTGLAYRSAYSPYTPYTFTTPVNPDSYYLIESWESFSVESPYIEDFTESKSSDIGRPNLITEEGLKEIHREATARIGQPYIPNTDINNMGIFYGLDFTEYNKNYGSIQKLYTDTHSVNLFQETKFGTVPISRILIEDLEGQGLVGITSDLLGKIRYSEEDYGIGLNGESHYSHGSFQWWCDPNRNAVLQLSPQGFRVISDLKAKFYFDQVFQAIPPYTNKIKLIGGYDKEFDEYLLSFDVRLLVNNVTSKSYTTSSGGVLSFDIADKNDLASWNIGWVQGTVNDLLQEVSIDGFRAIVRYTDTVSGYKKETEGSPSDIDPYWSSIENLGTINISGSAGNTDIYGYFRDCIAFSPKSQGWSSRYDFECDWWSNHGNKLASIKDGVFWKHNDIEVSTYGNFYGTQYDAYVEVPFNDVPTQKKQPLAIEIESNNGNWAATNIENGRGQESNIPTNYFKEREGNYFAPILRDTTTPNRTYPLLEGYKMIGDYLKVKLTNTSTSLVNAFSVSVNYMLSKYR